MSHIRDMYCMVKAVKKEARRMDRLETQSIKENDSRVWWSPTDNVKRKFLKYRKFWGWTASEAEEVLTDCCMPKYGYLNLDSIRADGTYTLLNGNSACDVVKLSDKGRKLIEKSLFIFPTGLYRALYEENGKVIMAFVGLLTAIVVFLTAIVGLLIKIAFFDTTYIESSSHNLSQSQSHSPIQSKPIK